MIGIKSNQLIIENLVVEDPDVVVTLSSIHGDDEQAVAAAREDYIVRALKIGMLTLQRAQTQVDIDAVRYEFDSFQKQVTLAFDDIFREDNGKLSMALNKYLGEGGKLEDLFDPERKDSAISRIQEIFDEHFSGDSAKFAKMLDYTELNSPIYKLHDVFDKRFKELEKQIVEVQKLISKEEGREEEYVRGTAKGADFEVHVSNILEQASRTFRDCVTRVGTETEGGLGKKGDILIEVSSDDTGGRDDIFILVETKRQKGKAVTGKTGILKEMDDAMATRNAQYAIAVFSNDACPAEVGKLRSYTGNRLVCSIGLDNEDDFVLEAAYQLARIELCWQLRHESGDISKSQVAEGLGRIEEKLRQFQGLKQKTTELNNITSIIRSQLDEIEASILNEVRALGSQL